jgi:iron complex outermembrane receptor protein
VRAILVANGLSGNQFVRFFTNAIDTRTRGVDVVGSYSFDVGSLGRIRSTLGFNHNETEITRIAPTPAALSGLGLTLFDRQTRGYFTDSTPQDKLILGLDWSLGALSVNVKETRYGSFKLLNNNATFDQSFGAKWITDLEVSYDVSDRFGVALGAYNVFDTYPDKNTVANTIGSSPYAGNSPFGGFGGYYYGRLKVKF